MEYPTSASEDTLRYERNEQRIRDEELFNRCRLTKKELEDDIYDGLSFDSDDIVWVLDDQIRKTIRIMSKRTQL